LPIFESKNVWKIKKNAKERKERDQNEKKTLKRFLTSMGMTFHPDYGGRDLPSTNSDHL